MIITHDDVLRHLFVVGHSLSQDLEYSELIRTMANLKTGVRQRTRLEQIRNAQHRNNTRLQTLHIT